MTQKFEDVLAGFLKAAEQNNLTQEQAIELYKVAMHNKMVPAPVVEEKKAEAPKVDEKQAAYVESFVKRASEYGMPQEQAITILKQATSEEALRALMHAASPEQEGVMGHLATGSGHLMDMLAQLSPENKARLLAGTATGGVGALAGLAAAPEGKKLKGMAIGGTAGAGLGVGAEELIRNLIQNHPNAIAMGAQDHAHGGAHSVEKLLHAIGGKRNMVENTDSSMGTALLDDVKNIFNNKISPRK